MAALRRGRDRDSRPLSFRRILSLHPPVFPGFLPASVEEACSKLVKVIATEEPDPELAALYEQRYQQFRKIYPAMKNLFPEIL